MRSRVAFAGALVAVGLAGCTPGDPCRLRASLQRGDGGTTVEYADADGHPLATCSIPPTPLGACDSGSVSCRDPAGNAVSFCEFDSCFVQP